MLDLCVWGPAGEGKDSRICSPYIFKGKGGGPVWAYAMPSRNARREMTESWRSAYRYLLLAGGGLDLALCQTKRLRKASCDHPEKKKGNDFFLTMIWSGVMPLALSQKGILALKYGENTCERQNTGRFLSLLPRVDGKRGHRARNCFRES